LKKIKLNSKGFTLAGAVLLLALLLVVIPAIILLNQQESKQTVAETKKTASFHLAEAGQDRGVWKLRESAQMWTDASSSVTISGYANDVTYGDVSGGSYKICFTAGPASNQVTVTSKGKANGSDEVRAIKAVYSKGSAVLSAISVRGEMQYKPNLIVEWGPIVSYGAITMEPNQRYPRKYCTSGIKGRDETNNSNNGALPSNDWANYDYAAYQDLGAPPEIPLSSYITKAKNSCVPLLRKSGGSTAAAPFTGNGCNSGYYSEDVKIQKPGGGSTAYVLTCSTCVIYIDGGNIASFPNDAWLDIEALLTTKDADFNARSTNYVATIPNAAQDEYQYNKTSPTATSYWTGKGWTNNGTYTIPSCGMHGFLYVGGNMSNAGGGSTMCGVLYVAGNIQVNTMTVYYDKTVAQNITVGSSDITRSSWDDIATSW